LRAQFEQPFRLQKDQYSDFPSMPHCCPTTAHSAVSFQCSSVKQSVPAVPQSFADWQNKGLRWTDSEQPFGLLNVVLRRQSAESRESHPMNEG
jgi:hypothetical protein